MKKIKFLGFLFLSIAVFAESDGSMKPFILAYIANTDLVTAENEVKGKLTGSGFQIVGTHSPYDNVRLLVFTNDEIKSAAAGSNFGGYAAGQRVSLTKLNDGVQVSYTNPTYMAHAYHLKNDLAGVTALLKKNLGFKEEYGPKDGSTVTKLKKYNYMVGMEKFDDPVQLNEFESYEKAIQTIESNLSSRTSGVSKVYRIDIPGKKETVFGVSFIGSGNDGKCQDDRFIMTEIDFKPLRSSAHLPYEMLVSGNKSYALSARFRIAINFPDLSMMGKNSFMNIMCAPDGISGALKKVSGKT